MNNNATTSIFVMLIPSMYDFATTAIGFAAIFNAKTFMQIAFVCMCSLMFAVAVGSTVPMFAMLSDETKRPSWSIAIPLFVLWLSVMLFNLFTTFIGNSAVAVGKEFSVVLSDVIGIVGDFSGVQIGTVILLTICVSLCTIVLGDLVANAKFKSVA